MGFIIPGRRVTGMSARKNNLLSVLILAILLLVFAAVHPAGLQAQNTFEGDYFSLEYPADWISREEGPQGMILEFVLLAPEEVVVNEFTSDIDVIAERLRQDISIEEYADLVLMQAENMLEDFVLVERKEIMVDGREGVELTYSGIAEDEAGDYNLTWRQAIMIEAEMAYILTLTAEQDIFSDYEDIYNLVVDSLAINN